MKNYINKAPLGYVARYAKQIKNAKNREAMANSAFELSLVAHELFLETLS
jgi:hypothetical protein